MEDIYISDIEELKELLKNNYDKCLENINKDSDIKKYFSENYLKDYFSKVDKGNPDGDIDLYVYNLMDELDFRYTCEDNIGVYIEDDFEISDELPDDVMDELSDKYGYYQKFLQYKEKYFPSKVQSMRELKDCDDDIGKKTYLEWHIDYGNRDYPFVYIDGKVYKGEQGETHTQLINRVFLDKDNPDYDTDVQRMSVNEIKHITDANEVAFGHVCTGMALIDDNTTNCSVEEVKNAVKSELNVSKVYAYDYNEISVTRLAKLKEI